MRIVTNVGVSEWTAFLETVPSTVYHTPQWKQLMEKVFNYTPFYLFALGEHDEIVGFLPLFKMKGLLSASRLCSVPFSHSCGPLGTMEAKDLLLSGATKLTNEGEDEYLEIRDSIGSTLFKEYNAFSTFYLDLDLDPLNVWKKLDKGSVRWAIKKAEKQGVLVETTRDIESIKKFYELNCLTKRAIGVPCHPWLFFKTLFDLFGENVQLYLAKKGVNVIGGGIFLYHGEQVLYGYGATNPEHLKDYPYNAFLWCSIKDACEMGYRYFDFGRTSYADTGLSQFKKHWGTTEKKLHYSFFPNDAHENVIDRNKAWFFLAKQSIQRIPLPLYKVVSARTFSYFG